MTVNQLFRECQKLKLQGYGEFDVMLTDLTDEPPVPQPIASVKILKNVKRVFLQSITLDELVAKVNKRVLGKANDSN